MHRWSFQMPPVWPALVKWEATLKLPHPTNVEFHDLAQHIDDVGVIRRFANLWMLEGVPAAFANAPADYELVRDAIASRLAIAPHSVSLVGSARFGYSYASDKWPKQFTPGKGKSDYDFFVCDQKLFAECAKDVQGYVGRMRVLLNSSNPRDAALAAREIAERERQLRGALFDQNAMRAHDSNPAFKLLYDVARSVTEQYVEQLRGSGVKLRVYRDWDAAVDQNITNLQYNLERIAKKPRPDASVGTLPLQSPQDVLNPA
jgi:hypothetical protein